MSMTYMLSHPDDAGWLVLAAYNHHHKSIVVRGAAESRGCGKCIDAHGDQVQTRYQVTLTFCGHLMLR
jgi:hypothetical protein